jgi:hypothetical protein
MGSDSISNEYQGVKDFDPWKNREAIFFALVRGGVR